jgi:hypothetical protein
MASSNQSYDSDASSDGDIPEGSDLELSDLDFGEGDEAREEQDSDGEIAMEVDIPDPAPVPAIVNPEAIVLQITRQSWNQHLTPTPAMDPFVRPTGPTTVMPAEKKEQDFFHLLFTTENYAELATETNRYATQQIAARGRPDVNWKETSGDEMKTFVGLQVEY